MKRLLLLLVLLITVFQGFSQTKGISYQAVILNPNPQELPGVNAENNILANSAVAIQFTIVNASGTEEYQEEHSTRTDKYGMINLLIGTGSLTSSNDFADIFWDGTTKKLKVGIDFNGGSNFSPLSEQNLTFMPQPPTEEVSQEIATNSAAILAEQTRAQQAEQSNANGISALQAEQAIQNTAIALNTAKVGLTTEQASTISNTTGINTGDQDISGIAINTTAIAAEAATARAAEMANANGISTLQAEQLVQNTAIASNTTKVSYPGPQDISGIVTNADDISAIEAEQTIQNTAIASNTAKVSYPGDQDISGIVTNANAILAEVIRAGLAEVANANDISTIEAEQTTQNTAIALNTAKTGITPEQATTISNTRGINTGDQDISGIAINSSTISMIQAEQTTQNTAIASNTAKVTNATHIGDVTGDVNLRIGDNKVTTLKILDANVTNAKLDKVNIPLSGFGAASADVTLGAYKLTEVATPTNAQDAATKAYVDLLETKVIALNTLLIKSTPVSDLLDAGFSVSDLLASGVLVADLLAEGVPVSDLLAEGVSVADLLAAGVTIADLLAAGVSVPDTPIIGTATAGNTEARVTFTALANDGGSPITSYTATSSGGHTGTLSQAGSGTITVTGLTNGTAYTFSVTATNAIGTSNSSATSNSVIPAPPKIGDFYEGGVVFWIDPLDSNKGLVCAVVDQSGSMSWWRNRYLLTGATGTAIGTGKSNTDAIIAVQEPLGDPEKSYAAGLARAYDGGGFTDWFLPSNDELMEMYLNIGKINVTARANNGTSLSRSYWSSTEYNTIRAWKARGNGPTIYELVTNDKGGLIGVRAIRAF